MASARGARRFRFAVLANNAGTFPRRGAGGSGSPARRAAAERFEALWESDSARGCGVDIGVLSTRSPPRAARLSSLRTLRSNEAADVRASAGAATDVTGIGVRDEAAYGVRDARSSESESAKCTRVGPVRLGVRVGPA